VIAWLKAVHAGTNGLHNAGSLMPAAVREVLDDAFGFRDMVVGVAQARGDQLDENLTLCGLIEVYVNDLPLAGLAQQQGGSSLHFLSQR
jgi:hypothetical protein